MALYWHDNRVINFDAVAMVDKESEKPWAVNVVMINSMEVRLVKEQAEAFWKSFVADGRKAG